MITENKTLSKQNGPWLHECPFCHSKISMDEREALSQLEAFSAALAPDPALFSPGISLEEKKARELREV
jgi:hypothetical protein